MVHRLLSEKLRQTIRGNSIKLPRHAGDRGEELGDTSCFDTFCGCIACKVCQHLLGTFGTECIEDANSCMLDVPVVYASSVSYRRQVIYHIVCTIQVVKHVRWYDEPVRRLVCLQMHTASSRQTQDWNHFVEQGKQCRQ